MKKMLLGIALMLFSVLCFLLYAFEGWYRFDTISFCIAIVGLILAVYGYVEKG